MQAGAFEGAAKALQRRALFVDSSGSFTDSMLMGSLLRLVAMGVKLHEGFKVCAWASSTLALPLPLLLPLPPPQALPLLP